MVVQGPRIARRNDMNIHIELISIHQIEKQVLYCVVIHGETNSIQSSMRYDIFLLDLRNPQDSERGVRRHLPKREKTSSFDKFNNNPPILIPNRTVFNP